MGDIDNSISSSSGEFINKVKKYKSFYKSSEYRLLIVRENNQWTVIGGVIKLSAEEKKLCSKELFSIKDTLSVIYKAEKFDVDVLVSFINSLNKGSMLLSGKQVFLSQYHQPVLENEEKEGWSLYDLKIPTDGLQM